MPIINVIKYEGNIPIYRHPNEDWNNGAQLIVNGTQVAVIVKDGKFSRPLTEGKYTIQTPNKPGLRNLVEVVTGGVSPNHIEVYFVQNTVSLALHWGANNNWLVQDPKLNVPFNMMVNGVMTVRISDPLTLLRHLVGTHSSYTVYGMENFFRPLILPIITSCISKCIISKEITCTELNSYKEEISETLCPGLSQFMSDYGLKIEYFAIDNLQIVQDQAFNQVRQATVNNAVRKIEGFDPITDRSFRLLENMNCGDSGSNQIVKIVEALSMIPVYKQIFDKVCIKQEEEEK